MSDKGLALVDADKRRKAHIDRSLWLFDDKFHALIDVGNGLALLPLPENDDCPPWTDDFDAYAADQLALSVEYPE